MDVAMFRYMYARVDAGLYSKNAHNIQTRITCENSMHGQHSVQVSVQPLSQCISLLAIHYLCVAHFFHKVYIYVSLPI